MLTASRCLRLTVDKEMARGIATSGQTESMTNIRALAAVPTSVLSFRTEKVVYLAEK